MIYEELVKYMGKFCFYILNMIWLLNLLLLIILVIEEGKFFFGYVCVLFSLLDVS